MYQWTITTGVWKTARKTFCYVTDPDGLVVFQHRRFWPCVDHLDAIGIQEYVISPDIDQDPLARPIRVNRKED